MSRFYTNNRFNRGEIDPSLHGRQDLDFYPGACAHLENWFPAPTGGVFRRPSFKPLLTEDGPWVGARQHLFTFSGEEFLLILGKDESTSVYVRMYHISSEGFDLLFEDDFTASAVSDLSVDLSTAAFGPAVFVTSKHFKPFRVFVSWDSVESEWSADMQDVVWLEELIGTVSVTKGSATWTGEGTLFAEQLSVSSKFYFEGVEYTVSAIANNTSMTSTANHTGLTLAGERISKVNTAPFGANAHPALCTFFQGRLILFSSSARPVTMWASKTGDPYTIVPGSVYDDAPIEFDLLVEGVTEFLWVRTLDRIFLGGAEAEFSVGASDVALTPTNVEFSRISSLGGSGVAPASVDSSIVFVSNTGRQLLSVQFDLQRQGFLSTNLTQYASHLFDSPIRSMAFLPPVAEDFSPRLYVVTDAGELRVCAIIQQEEVLAWHRVSLPAGLKAISVAAGVDNLYVVLRDPTTGAVIVAAFDFGTYALDFSQSHAVVAGDLIDLPSYFEGEFLTVIDPEHGWIGDFLVEDGTVVLPDLGLAYSPTVVVGLVFPSVLGLLPSAWDTNQGMVLSRKRRLIRAILQVYDTTSLFVNGQPLISGNPSRLPRFYTGVFETRFLGWTSQDFLTIETSSPYPASIASVVREVNL